MSAVETVAVKLPHTITYSPHASVRAVLTYQFLHPRSGSCRNGVRMLRYTGSVVSDFPVPRPNEAFDDGVVPRTHSTSPSTFRQLGANSNECRPLSNQLIRKLQTLAMLRDDEIAALSKLSAAPISYQSSHVLVQEGRTPEYVYVMIRGMGCRYKLLPSGQRQILGFLIPFDLCDLQFGTLRKSDHSIALLGEAQLLRIPMRQMTDLMIRFPRIERALALSALLDLSILREWLLNVGQRNAFQKLSHFFCEMSVRLSAVGQVRDDGSFDLPINQAALADTTGLTCVHINRTLQRLRSEGLVTLSHRRLSILDFDRLATIAGFDDQYLRTA